MSTHPKRAYPFLHIHTLTHVSQQHLSRSMAIAVRFVVIQRYAIEIAHGIQAVAHAGKMLSPDPHGAAILHILFPLNTIISQAAP